MQGRNIGVLLFVWPNAGGGKLQTASANPLAARRLFRLPKFDKIVPLR
jgi:hypothetical protein